MLFEEYEDIIVKLKEVYDDNEKLGKNVPKEAKQKRIDMFEE